MNDEPFFGVNDVGELKCIDGIKRLPQENRELKLIITRQVVNFHFDYEV